MKPTSIAFCDWACDAIVLGLLPGDRFAVLAANSHEYLELYHAAMFGAASSTL